MSNNILSNFINIVHYAKRNILSLFIFYFYMNRLDMVRYSTCRSYITVFLRIK